MISMTEMPRPPRAAPVMLSAEVLQRVQQLYDEALYVQAWQVGTAHAPLRAWDGTHGRILAGRLAGNLGAMRLSRALFTIARLQAPDDPDAMYFGALAIAHRRGFLAQWEYMRTRSPGPGAAPETRSNWMAEWAGLHGWFRDAVRAEALFAEATAIAPDNYWIEIERSAVLQRLDRHEESAAAARRAIQAGAHQRAGVQSAAHSLVMLGRDDEAIELLVSHADKFESPSICAQLGSLLLELRRFPEARAALERSAQLAVMADDEYTRWINARLCDIAYHTGSMDDALARARDAGKGFYEEFAARLESHDATARRVLLPVGFIAQDYMTCAPATLAAIGQYWSVGAPHDLPGEADESLPGHEAIADEICYGGTPGHVQRTWAEGHGWIVREFTMTWDTVRALADRGLPFALETISVSSGHLQAVVGYDDLRSSVLVRDPGSRILAEFKNPKTFESLKSTGPKAVLLVPCSRAALLNDVDLPDHDLWDLAHAIEAALHKHRREDAEEALSELLSIAPRHRITLFARVRVAAYDGSDEALAAAYAELSDNYPESEFIAYRSLGAMSGPARRDDRIALLRRICARPTCDHSFLSALAAELIPDARAHDEAIALVRRALARNPESTDALCVLADLLWQRRQFDEAFEIYRFALCLDDHNESHARSYFQASRHLRRTAEALQFLEDRCRMLGHKSSQPARTLYSAYSNLDRMDDALRVLDSAIAAHPADGELLLFAASEYAGLARFERARELLEAARGKAHRLAHLDTAASIHAGAGDHHRALECWREITAANPMAVSAHAAIADTLARLEGREAALASLRETAARHPRAWHLHRLLNDWLSSEPAEAEEVIRHLLNLNSTDAWAWRELAWTLSNLGRHTEAFEAIEKARQYEPHSPSLFNILGRISMEAGRRAAGKQAFREAIRLEIDDQYAIRELLDACDTVDERREALAFVEQEMIRQVIFGDGLLSWAREASSVLAPGEVIDSLEAARAARPDLWHAWVAVADQLSSAGRAPDAVAIASAATERFPLLPRVWMSLATAHTANQENAAAIAAIERALEIAPDYAYASRELATAHEKDGRYDLSRAVLERALARSRDDAFTLGCLADVLWKLGEHDAAVAHLQRAVVLEPNYDWGWQTLSSWGDQSDNPGMDRAPARTLTRQRPGSGWAWLILARVLDRPDELPERLDAVRRAQSLAPHDWQVHDKCAILLAHSGKYDDARAACNPPAWEGRPPQALRGRAAWIEAFRGNLPAGIALLRQLVDEDPRYTWGWSMLADWNETIGDKGECLRAARALVDINHGSAHAQARLAEALLATGDRSGATDAFKAALQADPANMITAGFQLFDIQMEDRRHDEAARTYELVATHDSSPYTLARGVALAARLLDTRTALDRLETLSRMPSGDNTWPLAAACQALDEKGRIEQDAADRILDAAVQQPAPPQALIQFWVKRAADAGRHRIVRRVIKQLSSTEDLWRIALVEQIESCGRNSSLRLRLLIMRWRRRLRADTILWGTVAYAFAIRQASHAGAKWARDWRQRHDALPWMLYNCGEMFRGIGKWREAAEIHRHALQLPPDHSSPQHTAWAALDFALEGRTAEAADAVEYIGNTATSPNAAFRALLTRAIIAAATDPDPSAGARLTAAELILREAIQKIGPSFNEALNKQSYWKTVRKIAKTVGGWPAWRWWLRLQIK